MATRSEGEHTFDIEVLVSGEELRGYSAGEDLTTGEPVGLSGDYQVSASAAGEGDFIGVNLYDVASGEAAALAGDDCEAWLAYDVRLTAVALDTRESAKYHFETYIHDD